MDANPGHGGLPLWVWAPHFNSIGQNKPKSHYEWSVKTDPLVMLHAKYTTQQVCQNSEDEEKNAWIAKVIIFKLGENTVHIPIYQICSTNKITKPCCSVSGYIKGDLLSLSLTISEDASWGLLKRLLFEWHSFIEHCNRTRFCESFIRSGSWPRNRVHYPWLNHHFTPNIKKVLKYLKDYNIFSFALPILKN